MNSPRSLCLLLAVFCLLAGGCGTGLIEKLSDIPDHCEIEWGTEGRLELSLQCT